MLDAMYQEGTDRVLDDRVTRPVPKPVERPSFGTSVWNTTKAPFTGVAAGAVESAATNSDILGAFGHVQGGYGSLADPSLLFDSTEQMRRQVAAEASQKKVQSGEAFTSEAGKALRATAKDLMPDPATANTAEQLLFGFTRFGAKAVGYSLAGGPVPGAVMTGVDEAMTEADKLAAEGVDAQTRIKVGTVAGVSAAAQVALPVAGKTIPQTVGLVVAGGPGSFVAQQALSRSVLENAGYDKLAQQYDPFDPVGLAVSTLVPAGFGAMAMRGARLRGKPAADVDPVLARELVDMGGNERRALKYNDPRLDAYTVVAAQREGIPPEALLAIKNVGEKSGSNSTSPAGAKGVMQFMDDTWTAYGKGDVRDPVAAIDGGARYLKALIDQYDGDVRAAVAHYNGGTKAGKAVKAGGRPPAAETIRYLKRVDDFMAERGGSEAGRRAALDPEAVDAARVQMVKDTVESWNLKNPADVTAAQEHLNGVLRAIDQMGAGERVSIGDAVPLDTLARARLLDDMIGRLETTKADFLGEASNMADPGVIRTLRDQIAQLEQKRPGLTDEEFRARAKEIQAEEQVSYKTALSAAKKDLVGRVAEIDAQVQRLQQQVESHGRAVEANEQVRQLDRRIEQVKAERAAVDSPTPKRITMEVKNAIADMQAPGGGDSDSAPGRVAGDMGNPISGKAEAQPAKAQADAATTAKEGAKTATLAASLDAQTAEIARLSPDLIVQLEGMDKPMRLTDALEAIKAEAANDVKDSSLLQVAAECFLRAA